MFIILSQALIASVDVRGKQIVLIRRVGFFGNELKGSFLDRGFRLSLG
jgi:hypothetical protein